MRIKPLKIKIKDPTPSAADRLYAKHQAIRKEKGLPDPSVYKKKLDDMKKEEVSEQLEKPGRFVSGPVKKPFKSSTVVSPMKEEKDPREYDYEGDMAISQLRALIFNAEDLIEMMEENTNLPEWVQTKITLAEDYISTAANYLRGELMEAANPAQQAAIAINMKKKGIKPKNEEVELQEGRPSQRHPLEGHEYHRKTNAELVHIAKDAHEAAEAMKSHDTKAENKYRDQANDSATVRYYRQKHGMADWYKKKYGHVKEEIEYLEEKNAPTNPSLWSKAKSLARSKFDVYPSAYANGWAAKWYKSKGGGWKTVSEDVDDPSMAARTLSRKAQIVKNLAKPNKKNENDEANDKFQKDPELASDIQKAP